jgi:hypothetical protein
MPSTNNQEKEYYGDCYCDGIICSCDCVCPCACLCDCPQPTNEVATTNEVAQPANEVAQHANEVAQHANEVATTNEEPQYELVRSYKHRDGPYEHVNNPEDGSYGWVYCYFGLDPKWEGVYRVGVTHEMPDWLYNVRPEEEVNYAYAKYTSYWEVVDQTHTLKDIPCMWQLCYAKKVYDAPRVLAH